MLKLEAQYTSPVTREGGQAATGLQTPNFNCSVPRAGDDSGGIELEAVNTEWSYTSV